jgi:hypothetical protein
MIRLPPGASLLGNISAAKVSASSGKSSQGPVGDRPVSNPDQLAEKALNRPREEGSSFFMSKGRRPDCSTNGLTMVRGCEHITNRRTGLTIHCLPLLAWRLIGVLRNSWRRGRWFKFTASFACSHTKKCSQAPVSCWAKCLAHGTLMDRQKAFQLHLPWRFAFCVEDFR